MGVYKEARIATLIFITIRNLRTSMAIETKLDRMYEILKDVDQKIDYLIESRRDYYLSGEEGLQERREMSRKKNRQMRNVYDDLMKQIAELLPDAVRTRKPMVATTMPF